ncbi:MAG: glycoside hydrolase family 38 C-terminal domain-containing protein [Bryobacteraceae bacterium]
MAPLPSKQIFIESDSIPRERLRFKSLCQTNKSEFCQSGERRFHEFRGYFIEEKNWASSAAHPAKLEVLESGPIRATVSVSGLISSIPFRTSVSLVQGEPRIDFHTQFRFEKDTWIGDPWEIKPELRMTGRRRSEYDDRYKLLALFPVSLERTHIYKNAAFDVCKSQNSNTFFQTWDTIKHNIAVNWVDLVDEREEFGVALFTDHTTSYAHGEDHPLSLVLGWGWDGGFWWGKCPLKGLQESLFNRSAWRRLGTGGALAQEFGDGRAPSGPACERGRQGKSFVAGARGKPGLYLTAMTVSVATFCCDFQCREPEHDHEISLGIEPKLMELVELDGKVSQRLVPPPRPGRTKIKIHVPRFGIRTVRVSDFRIGGSALQEIFVPRGVLPARDRCAQLSKCRAPTRHPEISRAARDTVHSVGYGRTSCGPLRPMTNRRVF